MEWTSVKWIKLRILLVSFSFVLFLGVILFRSYELHIFDNSRVHALASKQYRAMLPVAPKRGTIFDRQGKALALDIQVNSVALHPQSIGEADGLATELSKILGLNPSAVLAKTKSTKKFEWITRRISAEQAEAISALGSKGVSLVPEYRRFYPNKDLAGNFLGAVGYDAKALGGLELALDYFLKSGSGVVFAEKDAKGRLYSTPAAGEGYHDVTLTLDTNLQFIAEKHLREGAAKHKARSGFAIVMNPKTGEILALANYPSFNPNSYWEYPHDTWKNHATVDLFEPGSTFKTIIAAAALDAGVVTPQDSFYCELGSYRIGKKVIHDHEAYGTMDLGRILQVSSNIGITKVAQKLGGEGLYDFLIRFGFGRPTGLDLPGEPKGFLPADGDLSTLELSNIAFGQGIAVSGLQMAQAYAAFANGGRRMQPYLVSRIVDQAGKVVFENRATEIGAMVKKETAETITSMLKKVVGPKGTGRLAGPDGYSVAGKTGTAQKVNPDTKTYAEGEYVSSFIGYVPADQPEYVIYVVYDSPRAHYYGGLVAAPVFRQIAADALAYRGIPPEGVQVARSELGAEGSVMHD